MKSICEIRNLRGSWDVRERGEFDPFPLNWEIMIIREIDGRR